MALFTYPVFINESIANRCEKDFSDFVLQEKMSDYKSKFMLVQDKLTTKDALDRALKPMKDFIETNLPDSYVKSISTVSDPQLQRELWIARTFLFYQLMIFVVATLGNSELYTEVFGEPDNETVFPFREGFTPELEYYQMGIFGSKTPTSDIDVGIQYVGTSSEMPGLAYMISAFENVFVKLTGKSSLDFDIESYADMYLYKGDNGSDYFYLDIGKITVDEFKRILPVAGQSIARNVFIDHGTRPESFEQVVDTVTRAINNSLTLDKGHANFLANVKNPEIEAALKEPAWFQDSMIKMEAFLKMTYDEQRAQYYEAVQVAETLKFAKAPTFAAAKSLDNNTICELIVALGNALSYRMESYTASPTITHVVRILQANKEAVEKYATKSPIELCNGVEKGEDPYCAIGKYGFIISILEQIGYMYRFYEHYCLEGGNPEKCATKMKKYGNRYNDAFSSYDGFSVISPVKSQVVGQGINPGINPDIIRHHVPVPVPAFGGGKRTRRKRRTMKKHKNRRTMNKRRMCKGLKA